MPKKIVDIENLKKFREKLDDKYVIEGEYSPTTSVGKADLAENLTPYGDNSGTSQTQPFNFQSTAGGSDVGSLSLLRSLRGNTLVWNQLIQNGNFVTDTYWYSPSIITQSVSNNIITLTVNATTSILSGDYRIQYSLSPDFIAGHKYLLKATVKIDAGSTNQMRLYIQNIGVSNADIVNVFNATSDFVEYGFVYECATSYESPIVALCYHVVPSLNDSFSVKNFQLFDLTLMFGAGNETTDINEIQNDVSTTVTANTVFNRLFPLPYYSYNEGQLISCKVGKLITIGRNQFDGDIEQGGLSTTTGEEYSSNEVCRTDYIKVIAGQCYTFNAKANLNTNFQCFFYDHNQDFVAYGGTIGNSLHEDGYYTHVIHVPSNCQYVRIMFYQGGTNFTPSAISEAYLQLTWDNSLIGYEEYSKHEYNLPNVELRSAGSVYDEITPDGKLTRRIGTRAYQSGDENDNSVLTDGTNTYYVLENPTEETISPFAESVAIDDFGTMEFESSLTESASNPIIPQGNDFFYYVDYKAFIDSLGGREDINYDASEVVSHAELTTALNNIPTPDISTLINPTIKSSENSTYGLVSPDTTSYTANSEIVDTTSTQTISGTKTFGSILFSENIAPSGSTGNYLNWYASKFAYRINANFVPSTNGTRDIGASDLKWKDLYLSGTAYIPTIGDSSAISFKINGIERFKLNGADAITGRLYPSYSNTFDLGSSSLQYKDLYLSGNLTNGTNSVTVADLAALIAYAKTQGWIS